jgi:hypothetical protein
MLVGNKTDTVGIFNGGGLSNRKLRKGTEVMKLRPYLACGDPSLGACTPTSYKEAEGMTSAQRNASEKSPLLALYPIIILDIICIGKQGIKREEWNGVDICVPRKGDV